MMAGYKRDETKDEIGDKVWMSKRHEDDVADGRRDEKLIGDAPEDASDDGWLEEG